MARRHGGRRTQRDRDQGHKRQPLPFHP
jgi:hypothetical protein